MNDEEEVVRRLRELGARPVPDHVRARHLRALDSASGLLPVRRGRPNRRLLVGSIAAMSLVLVGAAAIFAGGDSPDRGPVVITDDGGTTSDTPTTPSSTPTDRQQTPDQDEPAGPFSDDSCKGPPPFAGQHPLPPGASGRGEDPEAGRQAESDEWEDQKQDCPPRTPSPRRAPRTRPPPTRVTTASLLPPPWA